MARTTISISKEALHFAAAHFTIFSATERENLHGHNFQVAADIDAEVGMDGLAFDYNLVKSALQALCDGLDERTLLPGRSPHLAISEDQGYTVAHFNGERIPFLPRDVLTLPVANITVEALADWLGGETAQGPRHRRTGHAQADRQGVVRSRAVGAILFCAGRIGPAASNCRGEPGFHGRRQPRRRSRRTMKYALVTGASAGIGLHTAQRFIDEGYRVINLSRRPCPIDAVDHVPCDLRGPRFSGLGRRTPAPAARGGPNGPF